MNKTMIKTVLMTVVVLAAVYRIPAAADALTGNKKFLGLF